ncbi:fungal-specific transcription factor domain-containing protein [Coniochaeta sp. 2T2.1]|nr:fungal-specific transcription factor domain-containing protein [Coniochaeta sp. 2T2.1]
MDAADVFRGLGNVIQRPPQYIFPRKPLPPPPQPRPQLHAQTSSHSRDDVSDTDAAPNRIAHTLTACCRCRQRKTRCDPTLPRCLPCERSGSTCEYYDTAKGKKISRFYVVKLQEKVRQLENELAQYTEEDNDYPKSNEEIVRPGGLVRLSETDETPRYLGPSSGIAMTRLVMEEAKRYTESKQISELIPDVRDRRIERLNRMQSVVNFRESLSGPASRKKSYPMISAHPAQTLPTRPIADKLVEIFNQRAQVFTPTLHEKVFAKDLNAVFDGDKDPYRNFVVRMVMAVSLQKLDTQYAGLADSYYLAAMQYFEDVVRSKDLKTLQCLILIGQYSLLTPTRTAVYFIIGLATRICQQLGLGEEKTISAGYDIGLVDPLTLDMRRRLAWIVTTNEFGLAQSMGRPSGFAKGNDMMDVKFFATVHDEHITAEGIKPGEPSENKLVAIHFCKMRLLQAEIRRILYEKSRPHPRHEEDPWFATMEDKLRAWRDASPEKPEWCRPWFTGRYHTMVITLYRPSPQVPKPTGRAALRCYESAAYIINLSAQQVRKAAIDITWVFLLTLYMSLNTLLWSLTYSEVRAARGRDEVEELVNVTLDIIDQCSERWPGTEAASQLYAVFAKACMRGYEVKDDSSSPSATEFSGPSSTSASTTPRQPQPQLHQPPAFTPPQFGYVFDASAENMNTNFNFENDSPFDNPPPSFRSNSIFLNPGSGSESQGRRFSYFPPEFTQPSQTSLSDLSEEPTPPATTTPSYNSQTSPPLASPFSQQHTTSAPTLPTPPESLAARPPSDPSTRGLSPTPTMTSLRTASPTPTMHTTHSVTNTAHPSPMLKHESQIKPEQPPRGPIPSRPPFTIPPVPQPIRQQQHQRPLPPATTVTDWFSPPPPFISPYAFSNGLSGRYWDSSSPHQYSALGIAMNGSGPTQPTSAGYASMSTSPGHGPSGDNFGGGGWGGNATPGMMGGGGQAQGMQYAFPPTATAQQRQGSLSQEQQMELMDVLETEGLGEIDAFLQAPIGLSRDGMEGIRWA